MDNNYDGLIIGMVPVTISKEYFIVRPKLKKYSVITESNYDYSIVKFYNNKFILDIYFLDFEFNKKFYKDFTDKISLINLIGKVFDNINILNVEYDDDWKNLLSHDILIKLNTYYGSDKVNENLQKMIELARKEFESHDQYEDYDFSECISTSGTEIITKYFEDIDNNLENIYIIQSLLYPGFVELYYELFCNIKKY